LNASLAERLKTETRALHTAAERSVFMSALLRRRMERPAYCALLRNLHAVYAVLEPSLERHAMHPMLAPVFLPPLWRTRALEQDLQALHGATWADELVLQPAAMSYVDRLRDLDASQPGLLLAHAYVRYLGDLSGGQMLKNIVAQSPLLDGAGAVAFYGFGDADSARELTQAFRDGLAAVAADDRQADALVDEAKLAFQLHQRLFEELAAACPLAMPREAAIKESSSSFRSCHQG
jgi:heme oxygenase (biliverdin-producing, ferredoxin)